MPLKRTLKISLLIAVPLLILVPATLLSTPMMDWYQQRIERNPDAESSRWLQMTSADWLSRTWRPEMAATGYRRFYERYKGDVRRPHALLRYAQSLEDCGRNADAIDQYKKYLIEYPDHDGRKDAEIGVNRINNCRN